MWLVEKKNPTHGGKLMYDDEQYRFRHVNSHLYLAVEPKSKWHKSTALISTLQGHSNKHREAEEYKFVSCPDGNAAKTLFTLHSAHHRSQTQENYIPNISAMFLESNNARFLKRGDYNYEKIDNKAVFDTSGVPKKADSLAMIITSVPKKRRSDATYGMDALPILVDFKRAFMSRDYNTISIMLDDTLDVVSKLTNFCTMRELGDELSYSMHDLAHLQSASLAVETMKETVRSRQQLFREQNILDCCMQLLRTFAITRDEMHLFKKTRENETLLKKVIENVSKVRLEKEKRVACNECFTNATRTSPPPTPSPPPSVLLLADFLLHVRKRHQPDEHRQQPGHHPQACFDVHSCNQVRRGDARVQHGAAGGEGNFERDQNLRRNDQQVQDECQLHQPPPSNLQLQWRGSGRQPGTCRREVL